MSYVSEKPKRAHGSVTLSVKTGHSYAFLVQFGYFGGLRTLKKIFILISVNCFLALHHWFAEGFIATLSFWIAGGPVSEKFLR